MGGDDEGLLYLQAAAFQVIGRFQRVLGNAGLRGDSGNGVAGLNLVRLPCKRIPA